MTSDDQQFLDTLASLSSQIHQAVVNAPNTINWSIDEASSKLRDALDSATWLPDFARPRRAPPPRTFAFPPANRSVVTRAGRWFNEHRAVFAAVTAFFGTGVLLYLRRKRAYTRKRRAKKSKTGVRCEIVVIAGSPNSPIARSVILDLERRGFIVYVATGNVSEEEDVKAEQKADILPLHLDLTNPVDVENTISQFQHLLKSPHYAFPGSEAHTLSLAGVVLIPDITFPTGPIETLSSELWSDELNAKLLRTILTAQAFSRTLCEFRSRLIILTPTIASSLRPPFQSAESTVVSALEGFTASARSELATVGVDVCHLRLGNFDCSSLLNRGALAQDAGQEVLMWKSSARSIFAENYLAGKAAVYGRGQPGDSFGRSQRAHGSNLRELNNAVFDSLTRRKPWAVQRIGQGSVAYSLIGCLAPSVLVRQMMGIKAIGQETRARELSESSQWEEVTASE